MQKEINVPVILDTIKNLGKLFLADYKKKPIPQKKEQLLARLSEIETTSFNVLQSSINQYNPEIPWVDDNEFDSDAQRKPAPYPEYWLCDTMDGAIQYGVGSRNGKYSTLRICKRYFAHLFFNVFFSLLDLQKHFIAVFNKRSQNILYVVR